jgi:hypothetical protein
MIVKFSLFRRKMFPDLSRVITAADVSTKGTGSYGADYVNWAKVAHLLQVHAQGWQFHLRMSPEGFHVWKAPNGTGYMVGYFVSSEGLESADFPQAVMDNRNNPVPFEKITARDVTDTHRRALCAAACFTFGLAYQLWAKEKVEDPQQRGEQSKAVQSSSETTPKTISGAQMKRLMAIANEHGVTQEQQVEIVSGQFGFSSRKLITTDKYDAVVAAYQSINSQAPQERLHSRQRV